MAEYYQEPRCTGTHVSKKEIFLIFFRIGIGTIGGGYAMIPMMEHEIVAKRSWLDRNEFADVLAIAQSAPGVFAVNMSSHIGQRLGGMPLAILATIANILPSFIIILVLAIGIRQVRDYPIIAHAMRMMRPAVVALIAVPVITMARSAQIGWHNIWIPILAAVLIYAGGISPILVILLASIGGLVYSLYMTRK